MQKETAEKQIRQIVNNLKKFEELRMSRNELTFPEDLIKDYEANLRKVCEITNLKQKQLFQLYS